LPRVRSDLAPDGIVWTAMIVDDIRAAPIIEEAAKTAE
jgi:hypothetical protein